METSLENFEMVTLFGGVPGNQTSVDNNEIKEVKNNFRYKKHRRQFKFDF